MKNKIDLFKELGEIDKFEPYICFEDGSWGVLWIELAGAESEYGSDFLEQFWDENLGNAIEKAYKWYKGYNFF